MTDHPGFLRAILAEPDDDTHRLVYSDWLEENGQAERAEFIRVQCELARIGFMPDGTVRTGNAEDDRRENQLRRRARHLLYEFAREWFSTPGLSAPSPAQGFLINWWPAGDSRGARVAIDGRASRGFITAVTCPLPLWEAHGPALVSRHPVERVEAADKAPIRIRNPGVFAWERSVLRHNQSTVAYCLPPWIYDRLVPLVIWFHPSLVEFDTEAEARDALSGELLAWAREQAEERGLMP